MIPDNTNRAEILLAAQSALVGEIFPVLRKVSILWRPGSVVLTYHVDAELSDDDRDSITSIEAEMVAHLPELDTSSEIILYDAKYQQSNSVCIFARR
jgi:hypothetical protein